jgi:hypothetical protein
VQTPKGVQTQIGIDTNVIYESQTESNSKIQLQVQDSLSATKEDADIALKSARTQLIIAKPMQVRAL